MKYWIVPSNNKRYRLTDFLRKNEFVDWKRGRYNFLKGDIVFIYCSLPEAKIRYLMEIVEDHITFEQSIKDEDYWSDKAEFMTGITQNNYCRFKLIEEINNESLSINNLIKHGLKKPPQCPIYNMPQELLVYIKSCFDNYIDPTELTNDNNIYEGAKKTIIVNHYERNSTARQKCIDANGCRCIVCGMDFESMYGNLGRGFIHVHHVVPIATIGKNYKIDPVKDLVPVCPNCHAMLHHSIDGHVLSVEELKQIIKSK